MNEEQSKEQAQLSNKCFESQLESKMAGKNKKTKLSGIVYTSNANTLQ